MKLKPKDRFDRLLHAMAGPTLALLRQRLPTDAKGSSGVSAA